LAFKENEQFICKVATNTKKAGSLVEDGLLYVTGEYQDGRKIFKKPKKSVGSCCGARDGN
jgi:hypothetical protein